MLISHLTHVRATTGGSLQSKIFYCRLKFIAGSVADWLAASLTNTNITIKVAALVSGPSSGSFIDLLFNKSNEKNE